jgi:hypothetical protein
MSGETSCIRLGRICNLRRVLLQPSRVLRFHQDRDSVALFASSPPSNSSELRRAAAPSIVSQPK